MGINSVVKEETNKAFELLLEISKNPALMKEFEDFREHLQSQNNPQKKMAKT